MSIFEAIFVGIIQGITEFLPISSDGHLVLVPGVFHLQPPDLNLISIAHQGTLLAVLVYFRRDLWRILLAVLDGLRRRRPLATLDARLGWYIVAGTIPAVVVGFFLKDFFERAFTRPLIAALGLFVTATFLLVGERLLSGRKQLSQMGWLDAMIIGVMQIPALLPGVSRSGGTIAAGLWRGFDRPTAARFSFLLGVPAIAGAGVLAIFDLLEAPGLSAQIPLLVAAFLSALVVGYAAIAFLLSWLRRGSLYLFIYYCVIFGALSLALIAAGWM